MTSSNQRGGIIRKNDNGTLERVDGTNTYIGSATLDSGRVITKRFRCSGFDEDEVASRWLAWQGRKGGSDEDESYYEEEDMAANDKTPKCPFSGSACTAACPMYSANNMACSMMLGGVGLYNIAANLMRLDATESVEMVAMAVEDLKSALLAAPQQAASQPAGTSEPTEADGVEAYLVDKTFLNFVNLSGKAISGGYHKFCKENSFPSIRESELLEHIESRYPELKRVKRTGGSTFVAA